MDPETGEKRPPDGGEEPIRRSPLKRSPDLASLWEAVDQDRPADFGALTRQATFANLPRAGDAVTAPPEPAQKPVRRGLPDLSILDDLKTPSGPLPTARPVVRDMETEEKETASRLVIDPDLEKYIYPDLWRKLNSPTPTRGILINTLDQVRSTLNLLSTFLPQHLVQEKMRRAVPGLVSGQILHGSLLFSDVSGFTALSERLQGMGLEGAEILTQMMNRYFGRMLDILAQSGGILLKFAGDAMLVYFPQQGQNEQVNWAVRAGQRMLSAIAEFSNLEVPGGKVALKMKIGIGSGEFLAASVGSAQRMEYVILGPAVAQTMTAESLTTAAGQMVVNSQTIPYLDPAYPAVEHKNGYYRVNHPADSVLDEFEIKAEVRRARGAISWDASPNAIMAQVDVTLRQIKAFLPYLSPEVVDRVVIHGQRNLFASQYRPTTVLFGNFWGFEELLSLWGEEGVSRVTGLLNAYFNAMSDVVARYGGMISRIDPYSKGTKILILFGAPVAHEDDPQRAASAALAMNAELEGINDTWARKLTHHLPPGFTGPLIQHRLGITTGNTFAGQVGSPTRREYTVMGDDVNLSARLMSAGEPGQILISQNAVNQAHLEDYFYLTGLAPLRVKGKSKPIAISQVQAPRDDQLSKRARERGALIGRKAELAKAENLLRQAAAGQGTLLILEGPAGIGKSHLADTLIQHAGASNLRVLLHQCRSYAENTSYNCWSLLLRQLAGIGSTDFQSAVHHQKLRCLVAECGLPEQMIQPLAMLMGLRPLAPALTNSAEAGQSGDDLPQDETAALARQVRGGMKKRQGSRLDFWDQLESGKTSETGQVWQPITAQLAGSERERVYGAVWAVLDALTQPEAGLIFFEDAHWMDAASQDLLYWIVARLQDLPLMIMLARRKGEERVSSFPRAQIIHLTPLTAEETHTLVSNLLIADLAQVIHEQSQGNPLFVEEITRWYQRAHRISSDELRSVLQTSNMLQKLILSHLENLPDELQEVAMTAAVIGNEFHTGEVQALLPGALDSVTLSNHLRSLAYSHLITLVEAGADARYSFQQSLVRDVLYNSLPYEKRRELHGRLGDYLSRPRTRRSELQAQLAAALDANAVSPIQVGETIAGHYERAERWLDAARQFGSAGDQARQHKDAKRAGDDFERGLAALEKLPVEKLTGEARDLKFHFHLALGDLALENDAYLAALTAYELARSTLDPDAEPEKQTALALRFGLVLPTQRKAEEAEAMLRGLLEQPGFIPGPDLLSTLAWLTGRAGRADARPWIEKCEGELGETDIPWKRGVRALLADLSGDWDAAREGYLGVECPAGAAMMGIYLGQRALEQGNPDRASSQYQTACEIATRNEEFTCAGLAWYRQAEIHWQAGDIEGARADLARAQAALEKAPSQMAAAGFAATRKAYKSINLKKTVRWPNWPVQEIADQYAIRLLFKPA
ncbi:protein containg AAA ATPase domain [Longilinea arvoryzae]|uniref:Protein containg AAA ATPase domain n=1 Tax=Longilinea arvoryzae TaxID=360412 RepID=A0A0S7BE15_9CHLR|nr:adenylate/guanylate cyclase domain-containing protein [Longilinea arvoryzae]GAP13657.1 protein containg AAA ATPase domain [Longilinea arvoryzae]